MEQPETGSEDTKDPEQKPEAMALSDVTSERGAIDLRGQDCVVSGNAYAGGVIRGDGNVLVQGTVSGSPRSYCVIDVDGEVALEREVTCARVRGRRIVIQGDVEQSNLQSDLDVEVHGNLSDTQVSLGNRSGDIQDLRRLRGEHQKVERQMDELKIRIGSSSRRFVRDYGQVKLQLGSIFVPKPRELVIDLSSFYTAVGDRTPEEVDRALEEFYLKVVVGMLTRANQNYIKRNPNRHTVFLKLIEELRKHVLTVREGDKLTARLKVLAEKRQAFLDALKQPMGSTLRVKGQVGENAVVKLLQFQGFEESSEGSVEIEASWAEARTVKTEGGIELGLTDLSGKMRRTPVAEDQLRDVTFGLKDGTVEWRPGE